MSTTRKWYISRALESYRALGSVIDELTHDEVIRCLDLESGSLRRRSLIDKLIKRAITLTNQALLEKYSNG
jgi:hypothetical protein